MAGTNFANETLAAVEINAELLLLTNVQEEKAFKVNFSTKENKAVTLIQTG